VGRILDRGRSGIEEHAGSGRLPVSLTLNEGDLAGSVDPTPDIDGPVRRGRRQHRGQSWAYPRCTGPIHDEHRRLDPTAAMHQANDRQVRLSSDWLDPNTSGMAPAVYYDDNTSAGVTIDGVPDSVPATRVTAWKQVSGGQGSIVQVVDVAIGAGQVANYYKDDQALDQTTPAMGESSVTPGLW